MCIHWSASRSKADPKSHPLPGSIAHLLLFPSPSPQRSNPPDHNRAHDKSLASELSRPPAKHNRICGNRELVPPESGETPWDSVSPCQCNQERKVELLPVPQCHSRNGSPDPHRSSDVSPLLVRPSASFLHRQYSRPRPDDDTQQSSHRNIHQSLQSLQ